MGKKVFTGELTAEAVKGIIFDMDGVIFDTERDSIALIRAVGKEMGLDITEEFVIENMGRNQADETVIYRAALGERFIPEIFWDKYWTGRKEKYDREGMKVKEGALKLLKEAKKRNIPCAIASSTKMEEVRSSLRRAGIEEYFTCVIGGDMFKNSKPQPDIFLKAAELLGFEAKNCIVIEDSLNGMKAGKAAGAKVIFVRDVPDYPEDVLSKYASCRYDSAEEIAELL